MRTQILALLALTLSSALPFAASAADSSLRYQPATAAQVGELKAAIPAWAKANQSSLLGRWSAEFSKGVSVENVAVAPGKLSSLYCVRTAAGNGVERVIAAELRGTTISSITDPLEGVESRCESAFR